ncbi:MAG: NAD-dependent epimerase/dehydratase family protein, partial [Candidatus Aenigmatarchaeota archaeon]
EEAEEFPVQESQLNQIPSPQSAYGFQKLAGEYYCRAYHRQYNVDYSIFRPFNAVGTREPPGEEVGEAHVIPDFVKKIIELEQHPLEILGDGNQIRSFTNVRDIARGVYKCAFRDEAKNEDFNLGLEEGVKMKELARKIWNIAGREPEIEFDKKEGFEYDVQKRVPSSRKATEELDWDPQISLEESLQEYVDWYHQEVLQ